MGTVVYQQGFQSSQLNEPRALRLKLSSFNSHFSQPIKSHFLEDTQNPNDDKPSPSTDSNSWSILQSLSSAKTSEKTYGQRPYCRTLSDESLALCTENLGSESGSDVTDVEDLFSLTKNHGETITESRTLKSKKRNVSPSDLPPPLTSMRGFQCIQIKPNREDGRLVMTAVNAPPRNRCFETDRSNGRLRLSILKDSDEFEECEEEEEEEDDEVMEIENVQRSRRCVDSENRGLLNMESLCVATS